MEILEPRMKSRSKLQWCIEGCASNFLDDAQQGGWATLLCSVPDEAKVLDPMYDFAGSIFAIQATTVIHPRWFDDYTSRPSESKIGAND